MKLQPSLNRAVLHKRLLGALSGCDLVQGTVLTADKFVRFWGKHQA